MRGMNIILKNSILFFLLLGCSQSSANMETALTTVVENGTAVTLEQITDFELLTYNPLRKKRRGLYRKY